MLLLGVYPLVLVAALLVVIVHPVMDPDCWFHMALGRVIAQQHTIPRGDIFSYTALKNEWISSGWASSVLLHMAYAAGGARGLVLLVFVLIGSAFMAVYAVAVGVFRNRGSVLLILLPAVLASYLRFVPRPEIASELFMTAVVLVLVTERTHDGSRTWRVWLLPLLVLLWANSHAGFLIGLVPVGLYGIDSFLDWQRNRQRASLHRASACLSCFAVWLVNPYGIRLLALPGKIKAFQGVNQTIHEWLPLFSSTMPLPWPTLVGSVLVLCVTTWVLAANRGSMPWWQIVSTIFLAGMMLYERRHAGIVSLALAAFLVPYLAPLERVACARASVVPSMAVAALCAIVLLKWQGTLNLGTGLFDTRRDDQLLPGTATEFLRANRPPDTMFNTYGPGGYLLYHLGPETKVFIDGRLDVYTPQVWDDYNAIVAGSMPIEDACSRYGINSFFLYTRDNVQNPDHLANRLSRKPDWKLVYFDDAYVLYVKDSPATAEYLRTRQFHYIDPIQTSNMVAAVTSESSREATLKELQRAVEISDGSAFAHLLSAIACESLGLRDEANRHIEAARVRNPGLSLRKGAI